EISGVSKIRCLDIRINHPSALGKATESNRVAQRQGSACLVLVVCDSDFSVLSVHLEMIDRRGKPLRCVFTKICSHFSFSFQSALVTDDFYDLFFFHTNSTNAHLVVNLPRELLVRSFLNASNWVHS